MIITNITTIKDLYVFYAKNSEELVKLYPQMSLNLNNNQTIYK